MRRTIMNVLAVLAAAALVAGCSSTVSGTGSVERSTPSGFPSSGVAPPLPSSDPPVGSGSSETGTPSGTPPASSATAPLADLATLTGEASTIALSPQFLAALSALSITPGLIGTAKEASGSSLAFPITGGTLTVYDPATRPRYLVGRAEHDSSGFTLTAGRRTLGFRNLVIDFDSSEVSADVTLDARAVGSSVSVFSLRTTTMRTPVVDAATGTVTLAGAGVALTADAARVINTAFGGSAVRAGLDIGTAVVVAAGTKR